MEIAFTRRYGIGVEFIPARGGAIIRRIADEAKAGVQYFDLHIGGTESAVTGLLAVTVGIGYSELLPFIKASLPVAPLPIPREGVFATGGYGNLTVIKNPPHPNASRSL